MSNKPMRKKTTYALLVFACIFAAAMFLGCEGDDGARGPAGSSSGTIAGAVTVSGTSVGIPDVTITTNPDVQATITTDATGNYSANLPIGLYTLTFERTGFTSTTETANIVAETTTTRNVSLAGNPVVVLAGANVSGVNPGDAVPLTATVEALDGSTIQTILWEQSSSAPVQSISPTDALATTVTLGDLSAYRDELFTVLTEPPIAEEDLPPNVELPEGGFVGGLQDRFEVVGLTPFDLEEAGLVTMKVTVTTSSGTYSDEVEIHATLPWKATGSIRNVPIGIPVLVHGGTQAGTQSAWSWSLTAPGSSTAALDGDTLQNPTFTPDVAGTYTLSEANSGATFDVIAGTWQGAISGQDGEGKPLAASCTFSGCHSTGSAIDQFTPWRDTGHAMIFTDRLNVYANYSSSCFPCHTVGFDTDAAAANGGMDDASDYDDFINAGLIGNPSPDNWTNMLASYSATAQLANIQCENCHGPQGSSAHMNMGPVEDDARLSLSSNVCGVCHGEPLRHGRFQQWQLSRHSNYELAIDEGDSGDCSRCHTANGFLAWGEQFNWGNNLLAEPVAWTADDTHPQTCATCHDPHAIGTTSGSGTDATTRITGSTPVLAAGWSASGVGNGAICMTCHNTRRGLYNDAAAAAGTITFSDGRAPHGGAQGDMVMGQNAFFVTIGARGPHSIIDDTCVNCHMKQTPPPDLLAYNQGGSNHTFFASIEICSECHTSIDGQSLRDAVEADVLSLIDNLELAIADLMNAQLASTDVTLWNSSTPPAEVVVIPQGSTVTIDNYAEFRGRQSMDVNDATTTYEDIQLRRVTIGSGVAFSSANNLFASYEEGVIILKAGWNILMVENDGTFGIHNPPFANEILGAAQSIIATTDFTALTAVP